MHTSLTLLKNKYLLAFATAGLLCIATERMAWALEAITHEASGVPCAILENFGGDVEVLDPSRTRVVSLTKNSGIPCGGWVSTANGWAIIQHRDGHDLRVGANTFLEIPENVNKDSDQVVLYRGEAFATTEGGSGELRVITANARVRLKRGTVLLNFSPDDQDTQLVALDGPASLENRFAPEKKVSVQAGESTSLNFKTQRVVPSFPKAVSVASLKSKLGQFRINEKDMSKYYETAEARAERRLAADLSNLSNDSEVAVEHADEKVDGSEKPAPTEKAAPAEHALAGRRIASEATTEQSRPHYDYLRSSSNQEDSSRMKAQWAKKMTAGEDVGERILYPDKYYGKPQQVKVIVTDPAEQMNAHKAKVEDSEKQRLIRELSQIRDE
jgi:hypothetical protein